MSKYNWHEINETLIREGVTAESIRALSTYLSIPYGTVYDAVNRGDLSSELFADDEGQEIPFASGEELNEAGIGKVSFETDGNEATLKFKAAQPLTGPEALELTGLDPDEWVVEKTRVNLWQMGRKHKVVDLTWVDGRATGYVQDDGDIKKTYLYQVELKLTRRQRIPVTTVIRPIEIDIPWSAPSWKEIVPPSDQTALFIADPHFGYSRRYGKLHPFHVRHFINALMAIAAEERPNLIVWNGDMMDLADWSRFDSEPGLLNHAQLAAIEASWVLAQFRKFTDRQVLLEGNHDERIQRSIVKHLQGAYQLRPVHELSGEPLLSLPRLLGLNNIDTEWIGGWPDAALSLPGIRFSHGDTVRKGSGRTTAAIIKEAAVSHFYGHVHRHELARKWVEDLDRELWVGSPGCACDRRVTPGARNKSNWQLGSFLVHYDMQGVTAVEHITGLVQGPTRFRDRLYKPTSYLEQLIDEVPAEYRYSL